MRRVGFGLVWLLASACAPGVASIVDDPADKPEDDELEAIDSDRDGLSDGDEAALGTDPRNPDSDGGGRLDGGEVKAGMNPNDVTDDYCWDNATGANCWEDADSDSLHDDDEVLIGTDPDAYDTDDGGLSDWIEVYYLLDPTDAADDGADLYADTDEDMLSDVLETNRYGTDPALADTDGGGLGDGEEIYTYGTDPLDDGDDAWPLADDDEDGLLNYQEGWYGTDPSLADTDGGGVSDYDELNSGTDPLWDYDDGTDPYLDTDGDWVPDNQEIRNGTDPEDPDTDGGGLTDGEELYSFMTDPLDADDDAAYVADTDGDGLRDYLEVAYGTDPELADTDGGGVDDFTEIMYDGTNPTDGADDGTDPYLDTDGDWVTDNEENRLGTDPNEADTDGGGLSDGEELYSYGTDPLDDSDDAAYAADSDGDGLTDYQEETWYGTDPDEADTDGGGVDDYTELYVDGTNPLVGTDDKVP